MTYKKPLAEKLSQFKALYLELSAEFSLEDMLRYLLTNKIIERKQNQVSRKDLIAQLREFEPLKYLKPDEIDRYVDLYLTDKTLFHQEIRRLTTKDEPKSKTKKPNHLLSADSSRKE